MQPVITGKKCFRCTTGKMSKEDGRRIGKTIKLFHFLCDFITKKKNIYLHSFMLSSNIELRLENFSKRIVTKFRAAYYRKSAR